MTQDSMDAYLTAYMTSLDAWTRRAILSGMTDISNLAYYAEQWDDLAETFERMNCPANAESCRARAKFYREHDRIERTMPADWMPLQEDIRG